MDAHMHGPEDMCSCGSGKPAGHCCAACDACDSGKPGKECHYKDDMDKSADQAAM